jgi:hypothetical protein
MLLIITAIPSQAARKINYTHKDSNHSKSIIINAKTVRAKTIINNITNTTETTSTSGNTITDTSTTISNNDSIPLASPDTSETEPNTAVNIAVLDNDSSLDDLPIIVSINSLPENGRIVVETDNTITYMPNKDFTGTDGLLYEVVDDDGDKTIASVSIDVQCSDCTKNALITLTWNPNPDDVLGYAVFYGPTADTAIQLVSELPLNSGLLNPSSPSVRYNLGNDLGVGQNDDVCFRLKAYSDSGYSDYSGAVCFHAVI